MVFSYLVANTSDVFVVDNIRNKLFTNGTIKLHLQRCVFLLLLKLLKNTFQREALEVITKDASAGNFHLFLSEWTCGFQSVVAIWLLFF